jgi:hypothetical protein
MSAHPNVLRGRMSAEEKVELERVIGSMKKPTPGKVARAMNRHPATVAWFMLTRGYIERKPGYALKPYMRNGKTVHPYSPEHDDFILELRNRGISKRTIGEQLTEKFGIYRSQHSVDVRLVQLAAAPDE